MPVDLMVTYKDRRPCWDLAYDGIKCKCGYGKPSGHASNSTMLYGLIFYHLIWSRVSTCHKNFLHLQVPNDGRNDVSGQWNNHQRMQKKQCCFNIIMKTLSIFLYYFIIISICWSRIYLGAHTFMHVLLGHFMSFFFLLIFMKFEKYLTNWANQILTIQKANINALTTSIFIAGFSIVIWLINKLASNEVPKNVNKIGRCSHCFSGKDAYSNKNLYALAYVVVPIGILLALYIRGKGKFQGNQNFNQPGHMWKYRYNPYFNYPPFGKGWFYVFGKTLLRLIVISAFFVPYLISLMIDWKSVALRAIFDYLSLFLSSFLVIYYGFHFLDFIGLYLIGDAVNFKCKEEKKIEMQERNMRVNNHRVM